MIQSFIGSSLFSFELLDQFLRVLFSSPIAVSQKVIYNEFPSFLATVFKGHKKTMVPEPFVVVDHLHHAPEELVTICGSFIFRPLILSTTI